MSPDTAFEMLLDQYVMPHAYSRGSRLPFGETAERAASFCTDYYVVELLTRFGKRDILFFFKKINYYFFPYIIKEI